MPCRLAFVLVALAAAPPRENDLLPASAARSIGPAATGGRIPTLAVVESDPATQYVGAAAGGLWKTTDDGHTWACVFAGRPNASIGSVAVAPSDPNVLYLGTGEANPRNSVSWGNGVFVSRDAGKTWAHGGLADTHHVGKIVVHPRDPNTAFLAALGHVWGPNAQRGLFVTRDGGRTWQHALRLDADTGCIDVALDHSDPLTVYAAAYRVRRDGFSGGNPATQFGPLAGVYRSGDGGKSWKRLTRGLPTNPLGRIGLAVSRKDPRLVYAVVQTDRTDTRNVPGQAPGFGPAEAGGVFLSRDRGETWFKVNNLCPRPFYFGKVRLDPTDDRRVFVLGLPLWASADGGRSFTPDVAKGIHVDHHDLWINPADPRHMVLGGDGGLYHTRDGGWNWSHIDNLPISQFYAACVDTRSPYRIFGGLQDNGTWGGPSRTSNPAGILNSDWRRVLGMDGFHCRVPHDDPDTLYAEGQYGRLYRIDLPSLRGASIRPTSTRPDAPAYRFNWSSPLVLSPHETKTLYYGGNVVFKSADKGQTWRVASPDLTRGEPGRHAHMGHTLTALAESPAQAGLLYAGSDDGKVHVTHDAGRTWSDVSDRLPGVEKDGTITRVECSPHAAGTAWLSLSRHRKDDRRPYLFRTDDHGQTWKSASGNLPREGPVHVVRADEQNPDLLFAGTEFGLFASLDQGATWRPLTRGVPPCPVHDLVLHPRERELVVATHGRGLYVVDVSPLRELTPAAGAARAHLFDVRSVSAATTRTSSIPTTRTYFGENPPDGAVIWYRLSEKLAARLEVVAASGRVVARLKAAGDPGLHRVVWDLKRGDGEPHAGEYRVRLHAGREVVEKTLRVRPAEPR
jgi:photosystem II stability/assembly factor-like uncharacterized protein